MLFTVVRRLNDSPSIDVVYFDEDKLTTDGKTRAYPWFNPGKLSPEYLLTSNYLMHSLWRRSLVKEVDGFDEQYQADYGDIAFCLQAVKAGFRVVYTPYARLLFKENKFRDYYLPDTNRIIHNKYMNEIIKTGDPFFNPNLSNQCSVPTVDETNSKPL